MATQPNYCVLDGAAIGSNLEIRESGLVLTCTLTGQNAGSRMKCRGTQPKASGQWMFEVGYWGDDAAATLALAGLCTANSPLNAATGADASSYGLSMADGGIYQNNALLLATPAVPPKTFIQFCADLDASTLTIFIDGGGNNGLGYVQAISPATGGRIYYPSFTTGSVTASSDDHIGVALYANFGQRAFARPIPGYAGWFTKPAAPTPFYIGPIRKHAYTSGASDSPANKLYVPGLDVMNLQIAKGGTVWTQFDDTGASDDEPGSQTATYAPVVLDNSLGDFDALVENADSYSDQLAYLRLMPDESVPLSITTHTLATFLIDEITAPDENTVNITFKDKLESDIVPIQRRIFPPWADPGVAGRPVQIIIGAARSVDIGGNLVDSPSRTFQVGDANCYLGVLRDKGNPLSGTQYTMSSDLEAVIPAVLPEGKFTADVGCSGTTNQYPAQPEVLGGIGSNWDTAWLPPSTPFAPPPGWTMTNTDSTVPVAHISTAVKYAKPAFPHNMIALSTNRPIDAIGGAREFSFHPTGITPLRAGKTYQISFIMYDFQASRSNLASGLCVMSAQAGYLNGQQWISPYLVPLTGAARTEVPFTLTYTVPAGADRNLFFTVVAAANDTCYCVIYGITVTEIVGTAVDIPLVGSSLLNHMARCYGHAGYDPTEWSQSDCEDIDNFYPSAPFGVAISDPGATLASSVNLPLTSISAVAQVDRLGVRRFLRLIDPTGQPPVATYTEADIDYPIHITPDYAPGLTQTVGNQRNWVLHGDADIVTDTVLVPPAFKTQLMRKSRIQQVCNLQLANAYQFARMAAAFDMVIDDKIVALNEMIRVLKPYSYQAPTSSGGPFTVAQQWRAPRFVAFTINYQGIPPEYLFGTVLAVKYVSRRTRGINLVVQQNVAVFATTLMPGKQKMLIVGRG